MLIYFTYVTDEVPNPVFLLNATLMIPSVLIKPNLDDVQESLMTAGKTIAGVAKGVAQWDAGTKDAKNERVSNIKFMK